MRNTKRTLKYLTVLGTVMALTASIIYFAGGPNGSLAIAAKDSNTKLFEDTTGTPGAVPGTQMVPGNFSELATRVNPAVVNIRTEKAAKGHEMMSKRFQQNPFGGDERFKDFFDRFFGGQAPPAHKQRSLGTGFIINQDGYIVTNNHVVEGAEKITVALKDRTRELEAEIVGRDPHTDIALIKVKSDEKLPIIKLGSSKDLQVGQWVVAIGNPFGLEHTVTAGIVSAKGRVIGSGPYDDFIQTDTSINPGNSGGPLINMKGEVVGINTMIIAGGQGIGFAIPIDMAKNVVKQLADNGEMTRGWLGVTIQDVNEELADYYDVKEKNGALVTSVVQGDPADRAGIRANDVIVAVNGQTVESSRDLTHKVAGLDVGKKAKVTVLRDGRKKVFTVNIVKRSDHLAATDPMPGKKDSNYGFQVTEITPELARRMDLASDNGLIVAGVTPGSKADKAGMAKGDVILEVNRNKIDTVKELKDHLAKSKDDEKVSLLVQRKNEGLRIINLA